MFWSSLFQICHISPWWVYYNFQAVAVTTTTAELSTCDQVAVPVERVTGWLKLLCYWAFTPPSVNTTLAGLLLHWHALGCAFALVSNHDIWLLSRAVQMLCCWIKHEAFPLFGFSHTVKWSFMDYVPSTYECNSGHRRCLFSAAVVSIVASQQGSWSRISSHGEWMFYKEMHAILIIDSSVCEWTRHFIERTPKK